MCTALAQGGENSGKLGKTRENSGKLGKTRENSGKLGNNLYSTKKIDMMQHLTSVILITESLRITENASIVCSWIFHSYKYVINTPDISVRRVLSYRSTTAVALVPTETGCLGACSHRDVKD